MENYVLFALLIIVMVGMRVPAGLSKFNIYLTSVVNFLKFEDPDTNIKNGIRLGLIQDELDQLVDALKTWVRIYALHTDPKTKTKTTRVTVIDFIKNFRSAFSLMLKRMDSSVNCTNEDRVELNIAIRGPYTRKKIPIKDLVYDMALQLGGGIIEIICRTSSDSKRASIHPLATGWFIAYDIVDPTITGEAETASGVKKTAPKSVAECWHHDFHSKARDEISLGDEHKGRSLVYFIRWYDHKNPSLSGPYGPAKTIIIL